MGSDGGEEDYEPSGGNGEDDGVGALEDEVSATEPSDGGEEDYELEFLGGESATGAMGNMASVGDAEYAGGLFGSGSMSADEYSSEDNANLLGESLTDEPDNFMKLSDVSGNIYYANMETKQIVLDKERDRKNELEFLSDGEDTDSFPVLKDDSGKNYYMDIKTKRIILDLTNYVNGLIPQPTKLVCWDRRGW